MSYPEQPRNPVRVLIGHSTFAPDSLHVRLVLKYGPEDSKIAKIGEHGFINWTPIDGITDPGVTFSIPDEFGRELLEQLLRHYQGASDMHTVRSDMLHERMRVDKLMSVIMDLAARPQEIHVHKAQEG
jgi:hypothetical protein